MGMIIGSIFSIVLHILLFIAKTILKIIKKILIATRLIVPAVLGGGFYLLFFLNIIENNPVNVALAIGFSAFVTLYFYFRLIRKKIRKNRSENEKKN